MIKSLIASVVLLLSTQPLISTSQKVDLRKLRPPTIVSQEKFGQEQCNDRENDPLGCNGVVLVIENLNLKSVVVTLDCGQDSETAVLALAARTRLTVSVELDVAGTCKIKDWR